MPQVIEEKLRLSIEKMVFEGDKTQIGNRPKIAR